jgi:ChrR Cupin-like domain
MSMKLKTHIEMEKVDLSTGWQALSGFPPGLEVKCLANDLAEVKRTGARSRLVRFAPGAETTGALVHDYWEEVYVLSGDMYSLDQAEKDAIDAPCYSCRPPGTFHGPFGSRSGCVLFEVQYYPK